MGSYNSLAFINNPENQMTIYTNSSLGRHFWIYILAPNFAAIIAGVLARKHYDMLEEEGEERRSTEVGVFTEMWDQRDCQN